jgi:plasmid stabilization system protein ParE
MALPIRLHRRAQADIDEILRWIRKRSPRGAQAWQDALLKALANIQSRPAGFAMAHERSLRSRDVRQALFKTRKGKRYRILFVATEEIRVLRIRGSGLRLLSQRDMPLDDAGELIDPAEDLH